MKINLYILAAINCILGLVNIAWQTTFNITVGVAGIFSAIFLVGLMAYDDKKHRTASAEAKITLQQADPSDAVA